MTFAGNCNYSTPADGAAAMVTLLSQLVSAGWTITSQSDGGTLGNAFDGAPLSWFAVQNPNGKSWCFQADSGGDKTKWRVKYANAPFIGVSSPTATQVPGCLGGVEVVLIGGGTDAAPIFSTLFVANGTYRWLVACDNASPYGWHAMAFLSGGADPNTRTLLLFDPLLPNSYPSGDTDPYVVRAAYIPYYHYYYSPQIGQFGNYSFPGSNYDPNLNRSAKLIGGTWVCAGHGFPSVANGAQLGLAGETGVEPYTGFEQRALLFYARNGQGLIGYSSVLTAGTCVTAPARVTGDVLQIGTDYYVRLDYLYLPWDNTPVVI